MFILPIKNKTWSPTRGPVHVCQLRLNREPLKLCITLLLQFIDAENEIKNRRTKRKKSKICCQYWRTGRLGDKYWLKTCILHTDYCLLERVFTCSTRSILLINTGIKRASYILNYILLFNLDFLHCTIKVLKNNLIEYLWWLILYSTALLGTVEYRLQSCFVFQRYYICFGDNRQTEGQTGKGIPVDLLEYDIAAAYDITEVLWYALAQSRMTFPYLKKA